MLIRNLLLAAMIGLLPRMAMAETWPAGDFAASMASLGATFDTSKDGSTTVVTMHANQKTIIENVPTLKKIDILNSDITQTFVNMSPFTICGVVATYLVQWAVITFYKDNPNADKLKFNVKLTYADDYGHNTESDAFSFNFTRALFNKINWDNLEAYKFLKIAPGFKYTDWFSGKMAAERH